MLCCIDYYQMILAKNKFPIKKNESSFFRPICYFIWRKRELILHHAIILTIGVFALNDLCKWKPIYPRIKCFEIWGKFHHHFTSSFYVPRTQKRKKNSVKSSRFLRLRDLRAEKLSINTLMKLAPGGNPMK